MEQLWPKRPKWAKIMGSVFAVASAIVGLAGAPDDIKRWYAWLESGVPWWVFLVASAILLLAVWGPSVWSYASAGRLTQRFRTLPPTAPSQAELAKLQKARQRAMKDDPLNLNAEKQARKEERAELKAKIQKLQTELQAERQEREHERAAHRQTTVEHQKKAQSSKGLMAIGQLLSKPTDPALAERDATIRALRDEVSDLEGRREQERAELKKKIQKVLSELETEKQNRGHERQARVEAEARATARFNELTYGITTPRDLPKLDEVELVVATNDLKKIWKVIDKAGRGALDLTARFGEEMGQGDDERNRVIARYFADDRYHRTHNLFTRLSEEVGSAWKQGRRIDYREWLIHYYEAYNELRRTIRQMATFLERRLSESAEYVQWRKVDEEFLAKIGDVGVMHDIVEATNERYRYPVAMHD